MGPLIALKTADKRLGDQGRTICEHYREEWKRLGWPGRVQPALDKDRAAGWERMLKAMAWSDEKEPILEIFSTRKNAVRTIPTLIHDDHQPEIVDDSGRTEDHAAEAIRNGIMYAFESHMVPPTSHRIAFGGIH